MLLLHFDQPSLKVGRLEDFKSDKGAEYGKHVGCLVRLAIYRVLGGGLCHENFLTHSTFSFACRRCVSLPFILTFVARVEISNCVHSVTDQLLLGICVQKDNQQHLLEQLRNPVSWELFILNYFHELLRITSTNLPYVAKARSNGVSKRAGLEVCLQNKLFVHWLDPT